MNKQDYLVQTALRWRRTEKELIADPKNEEKQSAHHLAKKSLRDAADKTQKEQCR